MNKARPPLPEGPYLVVGLARSGAAIARVLAERGGEVIGCDAGRPKEASGLESSGVEVHLEADGRALVDRVRTVIKSPGVPADAPPIPLARERERTAIGELEAAWRLLPNRFVAVTGTNGKSTVTELLGHLWRTAGEPAAVAGNVGSPLAGLIDRVSKETTVVCECSSFQLEDSDGFAPECAVFLNLAPDHLDRHPTAEAYLEAKLRIFANQGNEDVAVYNGSEPALAGRDLGGCARRVSFCRESGDDCRVVLAGETILADDQPLVEASDLSLVGSHNVENAMAAAAAAIAMGIGREFVRAGLASFEGLPHRLERVREFRGVIYINDSKATNVAAARAAVRSFRGGVRAILGGSLKGEGFDGLVAPVSERCRACYLIGEAAERLERDLAPAREAGVEVRRCETLADAVRRATSDAREGEVVLLTPACASFDAYRDFEERGEHFRALVAGLG